MIGVFALVARYIMPVLNAYKAYAAMRKPELQLPEASHLLDSVLYLVILLVARYFLSTYVFIYLAEALVAPAKPVGKLDPGVRALRVGRFGACVFKFVYFTFIRYESIF